MNNKGWLELESDPGLFTLLVEDFGVRGVQVEEIYDLQKPIEGQVYGFIFLFRWIEERRSRRKVAQEVESLVVDDKIVNSMFFAHQVIPNSCATHALLSVLLNCEDKMKLGDVLAQLKQFTQVMSPEDKGFAIGNMPDLARAHNSHARPEPYRLPEKQQGMSAGRIQEAFHFVSYVPINGHLFELDGLKPYPIDHGPAGEVDWTETFRRVISERLGMATGGEPYHDIRFNLMAVVPDRRLQYEQKLKTLNANRNLVINALQQMNKDSGLSSKTTMASSRSVSSTGRDALAARDSASISPHLSTTAPTPHNNNKSSVVEPNGVGLGGGEVVGEEACQVGGPVAMEPDTCNHSSTVTTSTTDPDLSNHSPTGSVSTDTASEVASLVGDSPAQGLPTVSASGQCASPAAMVTTASDLYQSLINSSKNADDESNISTDSIDGKVNDPLNLLRLLGINPVVGGVRSSTGDLEGNGACLEKSKGESGPVGSAATGTQCIGAAKEGSGFTPPTPQDLLKLLKKFESEIQAYDTLLKDEIEKRKKYKVDDCRRTHNYDDFITTFLSMLDERDQLTGLVEQHMLTKRRQGVNVGRLHHKTASKVSLASAASSSSVAGKPGVGPLAAGGLEKKKRGRRKR